MAGIATKGFTLVEILIVVIILGVLAAIAIPQFSNATASARASMLGDDLRVMRTQIMVFQNQHNSIPPGYPGGDTTKAPAEATFLAHITLATKVNCATAAPGTADYPYGPYMREMPENPINGKRSVLLVPNGGTFPTAPSNGYGWVYEPSSLLFRSDATGTDEYGRAYFDY